MTVLKYLSNLVAVALLCATAMGSQAAAAGLPSPEFDPVLSLVGNCNATPFDPVPDPSCSGEPPAYPPPPGRPSARFDEPRAIAIDTYGNEYVASYAEGVDAEGRIDIFDSEGEFVTEFAAPNVKSVAVDSDGNAYVFEDNGKIVRYDPEEGYDPEGGEIAYEDPPVLIASGSFIGDLSIDPSNDQLFAAAFGVVTRYRSAAEGNGVVESFEPAGLAPWTEQIAVDGQRRRLYVTFCKDESEDCAIKVLAADPPHSVLGEIDGSTTAGGKFFALSGKLGIAIDEETGDVFVADLPTAKKVYQYKEDFELASELSSTEFQATVSAEIAVSNGKRSLSAEPCDYPSEPPPIPGDACNRHYLFVPNLKSAGRALAFQPSDIGSPDIEGTSVGSIAETEAELRATINPAGADTAYTLEFTTQEAFESEGFDGALVAGEGLIAGDNLATQVSAFALELSPGVAYRFRVVAENEVGQDTEEGVFTTYRDPVIDGDCPNSALRLGSAARLPDCRAYELVTPPDTNGRPPRGVGFVGDLFSTVLASAAGNEVSFKIEGGSLPGTSGVGSFEGDPYRSTRSSSGWTTALAGPSGDEATVSIPGSVSPDQKFLFWTARIEGPLVIEGEPAQYIHYPDGHSELVGTGSLGIEPKAHGRLITEGAAHVIFETNSIFPAKAVQLEPNAPPTGTGAIYDRTSDGVTHVVSLLPGDQTPGAGKPAVYKGASSDGTGVAFTVQNVLYLRVGNETTYEIGTGVEFAGVAEGGSRIFYVEGGDLFAFDTSTEQVIEFSSTGDVTPVNVPPGGTRAYFVSPTVLGGANPEGDEAQAGKQNLYLSEEGAISFVATVTDRDVEGEPEPFGVAPFDGLGLWVDEVGGQVARDPSRTNPDGSVLLFQSRADIAGNEAGELPQIYRYDAGGGRLHCISCSPTGIAPTGGASLESYTFDTQSPLPFSPYGFVANLTPRGDRAFFESDEALVSTDTDAVQDVYEWEEDGVGGCATDGGCVYLISSGQSSRDNFLYGHSTSGDDVFFTTGDGLAGSDNGGATSIYDARVGGGFPESEDPICVADGCRPVINPAPAEPAPQSSAQGQSGNPSAKKAAHCPKGKRKVKQNGKARCVKKKKQKAKGGKAKRRAGTNRGAGR